MKWFGFDFFFSKMKGDKNKQLIKQCQAFCLELNKNILQNFIIFLLNPLNFFQRNLCF